MPQTTLLRYLGGKSKIVRKIAPYIKISSEGVYCEPFVGGGSVALAVASITAYKDIRIILNDLDPEVANFWSQVINPDKAEAARFIDYVNTCNPSVELYDWMKLWQPTDSVDRAFRFLFLNRTSYAASHCKRPLGGRKQPNPDSDIRSRFKPHNIVPEFLRARRILLGRTTVYNKNFSDIIINAEPNWVIYADPPYYERDLYNITFSQQDHICLLRLLTETPADWVLSYQEHPTILDFYKNMEINIVTTNHSMTKRKRNELIITPV